MDSNTKTIFTKLNKEDNVFNKILEKITKNDEFSNEEYSYILSLALIFYDEYLKKDKIGYMEFSYYLVLKYSLKTKDFNPLLMFSVNNGLYPIAKSIFYDYDKNIHDVVFEEGINFYKKEGIYELKKQFESRKALIESAAQNRAYIAPTSYGKSSAIIEDIFNNPVNKIGIIVPKKALIWQTFRNIKNTVKNLHYKILLHDTEYNNEEKVICIFTQERAIRLLQDSSFAFDTLYIDEAHNLFEKDERNVLLARLIKLNKKINSNHRVVYLSPLIKDANDLIFFENDNVDMKKIDFNIKELNVALCNKDGSVEVYNRFVDSYYFMGCKYDNHLDYIFNNLGKKNLFYFNRPKDIENFSQELLSNIKMGAFQIQNQSNDMEIKKIADMISKYVDNDYNLVELINFGIIYIHGKMPDVIKDYLISKFTSVHGMKILISNSSILEGMNLSLDTMFIFDVYGLKQNDLFNLVGRINRLSDVFLNNDLSKLFCDIHFIDYGLKSTNIKTKISLLRSDVNDEVQNPLLLKANLDDKGRKILEQENSFIDDYLNKDIKTILIKNGIASIYKDVDSISQHIANISNISSIRGLDLINKISKVFFNDCENVTDFELVRLNQQATINFYKVYVKEVYHLDLKSKIRFFKSYFEKSKNEYYFIGESFGEIPSEINPFRNVYVNIKNKTPKEKINLSVIKSKIEDDFVGFKLGKFVKVLLDLSLIEESEYNMFTYGTNDKSRLTFIKMGLSQVVIKFIEKNQLEKEITIKNGVVFVNDKFRELLEKEDDFIQFEVGKIVF